MVNVGLAMSAIELLTVALHETYPGQQAERACKEQLLVRSRGLVEETLVLAPAPQSVVSEGIAELAPQMLLAGDGGAAFAAILRDAGVEFGLAHALAIEQASKPCRRAAVNAALMLHQAQAGEDEVHRYLQWWGLMTAELAAHLIRFITEPASRSYVTCYPAGHALCRAYVAGGGWRRLARERRVYELVPDSSRMAGRSKPRKASGVRKAVISWICAPCRVSTSMARGMKVCVLPFQA